MSSTTTRLSAAERKDSILDAALVEFAERGYQGTSTEDIAKRAGISQPYLFRLFGTKKDLYIASVGRCYRDTLALFQRGAEGDRRGVHGAAGDRPDVAARPDAGLRRLGGPGHPPGRARGLRRPDRLRPPCQRRRLAHDLALLRDGDAPERPRLDARHRQPGALDERAARGLRQGPVSRFFFTTEVV